MPRINDVITSDEYLEITCGLRNRQSMLEEMIASGFKYRNDPTIGDTMRSSAKECIKHYKFCETILEKMGSKGRRVFYHCRHQQI